MFDHDKDREEGVREKLPTEGEKSRLDSICVSLILTQKNLIRAPNLG